MIGLFILFVACLWLLLAVIFGFKIPKWLGLTRYRITFSILLSLLILIAPVADEVIAYPQVMALCKNDKLYALAPEMGESKATGRTVYYTEKKEPVKVWPSTVKVSRTDMVYLDAVTKESVLIRQSYRVTEGMLGMPAGSSGDKMAILLGGCGSRVEPYSTKGLPSRFSHLNLTKIATP